MRSVVMWYVQWQIMVDGFPLQKKHCVLKTVHPSPLSASRGFFGCEHFSKANEFLRKKGKKEIDWNYLPKSID